MVEKKKRKEVLMDEVEAGRWIRDGMTIIIGGFITSSHPMAIIRQIARNRVRNLTVVGAASSGLDIDLLIAAGCVKKVVSPYVGAETLAPIGPCFRIAAERGEIDVWEIDEAMYYAGLRAAAQMLPFMPWKGCVGTCYPEVNPDIKEFKDPIKGERLLAVPAIEPEIAIIHAAYADVYGNVQHIGTGYGDRAIARSADKRIVQVEKIVTNQEIRRDPLKTTIFGADAIIRAAYGAHPYSSPGFYLLDKEHIKNYVKAANLYTKENDRGLLDEYLEHYIYEPESHIDYLERVGIRRLLSLYEY
jgi:glutaconate CoA-transferase subunit A